jgi:hypothetical protein
MRGVLNVSVGMRSHLHDLETFEVSLPEILPSYPEMWWLTLVTSHLLVVDKRKIVERT